MNKSEKLRAKILELVREYYFASFHEQPFLPGKTRINYGGRVFDDNELINLIDASLDFWLTSGRYVNEFEDKLSKFLSIKHCLMVNSGSSANLLAFMALTSPLLGKRKIRRGDEVITTACAFPTTVAPIIQFGAVPVFVDVELDSVNPSIKLIESAYTQKTRVVMLAHTLGNPFDAAKLRDFCDSRKIWLIEDNCDSLGSRLNGQFTGTFGHIGTSSFYPPHHITTGEGGAVYTNDDLLNKIMRSMRDWGRDCSCPSGEDNRCGNRFNAQYGKLPFGYDHKYVYSHFGYNLKPTEMQAAIGCAQLDKLPWFIERRKQNFNYLNNALKDIKEFTLFEKHPESVPSWFGFLITLNENAKFARNDLVEYLEKNNIQTRKLFAGNITRHPCFYSLKEGEDYRIVGELKNTDKIMNDSFWIGVYPGMTKKKLDYMADTIKNFIEY